MVVFFVIVAASAAAEYVRFLEKKKWSRFEYVFVVPMGVFGLS